MSLTLGLRGSPQSSLSDPSSDSIPFQQQGAVDWVSLGSHTVRASIDVISRISTAGVDPWTLVVGRAIGGSFEWRHVGRERFDAALQSRVCIPGFKEVLWFGVGIKNIVDVLASTDQGAACAALCSCLSECYSVPFSAGVLVEMTKSAGAPEDTTPSLQQWRALINSCAGIFAASNFGIRAEHFMGLDGEARIANNAFANVSDRGERGGGRGVSSREAIAEALLDLGKLSKGLLHEMTIIGRADIGFIAAVADWLFGLDVEIKNVTGDLLFTNYNEETRPQLLAIYASDATEGAMLAVGKTYILPDATQIIKKEFGPASELVLSGRVQWKHALGVSFHSDFHDLMGMGRAFGGAIGSASQLFELLYYGGSNVPREWLNDCRIYYPQSHGTDFIYFIQERFPELQVLNDIIRRSANHQTYQDIMMNHEAQMKSLQLGCGCQYCTPQGRQRMYCLVILARTIIKTARYLSGILASIDPKRAGLEEMYVEVKRRDRELGLENIIENQRSSHLWNQMSMLDIAETIYGGRRLRSAAVLNGVGVCAVADHGICYYYDLLREISTDAGRLALVHVTPGQIIHRDRSYSRVRDGGGQSPPATGSQFRPSWAISNVTLQKLPKIASAELQVLVKEQIGETGIETFLNIQYGASVNGKIESTNALGPGKAVLAFCSWTGLVHCKRGGRCEHSAQCQELIDSAYTAPVAIPQCSMSTDGKIVFIHGNAITSLFAAAGMWDPIIQRDECKTCCLYTGISLGWEAVGVIMDSNT